MKEEEIIAPILSESEQQFTDYMATVEDVEVYSKQVSDTAREIRNKILQDLENKPFSMVLKILFNLVAFFLVMLKPSGLKWYSMIKIALLELKKCLHLEIAQCTIDEEYDEGEIEGGVPMYIDFEDAIGRG